MRVLIGVQLSLDTCPITLNITLSHFNFIIYVLTVMNGVFTATDMLSRNNSRVIMVQPVPTDNSVMPSTIIPIKQNGFGGNCKTMSPYEYQIHQLEHDPRTSKEVLLGKRVRFYHIKGTLGTGNFSKVRLGVHLLTKGTTGICFK